MADVPDSLERFHDLPFPIEVELGRIAIDIESVLGLQEGDVLRTERPAGAPLPVLAGGVRVAFADLVTMKDKVAARITRVQGGRDGRL
jgi:flagellar motor switch/type III secretory pathway protein FliN